MSLEIWLAYVVTCLILVAIPGPTVIIVISYALGRGKQSAWFTVPGVGLGDLTAMTVALLGAGAILAASSQAFTLLKLFGAAYLVWLGSTALGPIRDVRVGVLGFGEQVPGGALATR